MRGLLGAAVGRCGCRVGEGRARPPCVSIARREARGCSAHSRASGNPEQSRSGPWSPLSRGRAAGWADRARSEHALDEQIEARVGRGVVTDRQCCAGRSCRAPTSRRRRSCRRRCTRRRRWRREGGRGSRNRRRHVARRDVHATGEPVGVGEERIRVADTAHAAVTEQRVHAARVVALLGDRDVVHGDLAGPAARSALVDPVEAPRWRVGLVSVRVSAHIICV